MIQLQLKDFFIQQMTLRLSGIGVENEKPEGIYATLDSNLKETNAL